LKDCPESLPLDESQLFGDPLTVLGDPLTRFGDPCIFWWSRMAIGNNFESVDIGFIE
jgi:hypothetical protein